MRQAEDIGFPYYYLLDEQKSGKGKRAIFLGNDFHNMSGTLDRPTYIDLTNKCLEYMRRECAGCELVYKPHPNETDEYTMLDLHDFTVVPKEENEVAEVYFWRHADDIKYVFAIASGGVWSAHTIGLNAYTFLKVVEPIIGKDIGSAWDYYKNLPPDFFINDFSEPLKENRRIPAPDIDQEKKLMSDIEGDAWFIVGDPGLLVLYISFVRMTRRHHPEKKVHLILPFHHRWHRVKEEYYRSEFESIHVFSRGLYSLRPRAFLEVLRTTFQIRHFKLPKGDTLLCFGNTNLVENAFVSFFKNKKIAIQYKDYFELNYGIRESDVLKGEKLKQRWARAVFTYLIEPVLGLYRSVYREYGDGTVINISRFLADPSKIYDRVYLLVERD